MRWNRCGWACALSTSLLVAAVAVADDPPAPAPRTSPYAPVANGMEHLGQHILRAGLDMEQLRRPVETPPAAPKEPQDESLLKTPVDPPLGYAGPSGVLPTETQENSHFVPVEDRWRIGFPDWDRYDKGHPRTDDYPFVIGDIFNPYKQNVLKGDYPILGQHTFLNVSATSLTVFDAREVPTATTPFESTANPFQQQFFGKPAQFFYTHYFKLSLDLNHGDAAFKPVDWRIKITPVFNINSLNINELAGVSPDVREGTGRGRTWTTLEEWFVEAKLADLGTEYDFVSMRAGSQFFNADFRGFLFSDTNRAVRLFGTRDANREQFNLVYFDQLEKDTNSELNQFRNRNQHILIGNYYYQDFIWPGYTAQVSATYNRDEPTFHFNKNKALVRPDPDGVFQPHGLDVCYLGWAGDGHINRFNITHQFYWALGHDSLNPLANRPQDINAQFFAIELSYDRDYVRFRTSFMYSSGDHDINNSHATGFDSIFDNPNFAGGEFSYWQRQAIQLFGVNLVNARSIIPDLRASKIEGQSNFVNPGLLLANFGMDVDITPKLKSINNLNFMWFDDTNVLQQFVFQGRVNQYIGADVSTGLEYRPFLNNNVIITTGISSLIPGRGFTNLYDNLRSERHALLAGFMELNLNY